MKLVFVSPVPLFPATGGNRMRTLQLIRTCRARGHEVHFVFLPSRQMGEVDLEAHVALLGAERFHALRRGGPADLVYYARRAWHKLRRRIGHSRFLLSDVDETYFRGFTPQLARIDRAQGFDAAVVQYVTFTRAFDPFGASTPRILDTQDSFEDGLPAAEERRGLMRAHRILAIQEREAGYFRELLQPANRPVAVVSHIIDIDAPLDLSACAGAAFIGSDFRQNNASLAWFIDQVLPRVRQQAPEFRLFVSGTVCRQVGEAPGVVTQGVVSHFRDAFREAPLLVNCITQGTGVKIKLLEAFGHGVPAISTERGVEGIARSDLDGVQVVPDGDAAAFAEAVLRLYRDRSERIARGRAAFAAAASWNERQIAALFDGLQPVSAAGANPRLANASGRLSAYPL